MEERRSNFPGILIGILKVIVIALLINVLVKGFLIRTYTVDSSSMQQTLMVKDRVITEVISYYFTEPEHGDVVVFVYPETDVATGKQQLRMNSPLYIREVFSSLLALSLPEDREVEYVKRVIGVPGDEVDIRDNQVFVNGEAVDEPYVDETIFTNTSGAILEFPYKVPENQYFVLGDNRENSFDSRYWGTVPRENIIGKAVLVFYPLDHFGGL